MILVLKPNIGLLVQQRVFLGHEASKFTYGLLGFFYLFVFSKAQKMFIVSKRPAGSQVTIKKATRLTGREGDSVYVGEQRV